MKKIILVLMILLSSIACSNLNGTKNDVPKEKVLTIVPVSNIPQEEKFITISPVSSVILDKENTKWKEKYGLEIDSFKDRKTDNIDNIIERIKKVNNSKKTTKGEFETTEEYNKRVEIINKQKEDEIKEMEKEIYVFNFSDTLSDKERYFHGGNDANGNYQYITQGRNTSLTTTYNADLQFWNIEIKNNVNIKSFSMGNKEYGSNAFGASFLIDNKTKYTTDIILKNSKDDLSFRIPMKIEEAKEKKSFFVQLIYKPIEISDKASFSFWEFIEPTVDKRLKSVTWSSGLNAKLVAVIVWDSEKTKILGVVRAEN